jgi:hypothetical protein
MVTGNLLISSLTVQGREQVVHLLVDFEGVADCS